MDHEVQSHLHVRETSTRPLKLKRFMYGVLGRPLEFPNWKRFNILNYESCRKSMTVFVMNIIFTRSIKIVATENGHLIANNNGSFLSKLNTMLLLWKRLFCPRSNSPRHCTPCWKPRTASVHIWNRSTCYSSKHTRNKRSFTVVLFIVYFAHMVYKILALNASKLIIQLRYA